MKIKGLYLVTDPHLTLGRSVEDIALQACSAGIDVLQFRDKFLSDCEFLRIARSLREITKKHGTVYILNDRIHLVTESEADGVHVGQSDITPGRARSLIGNGKILGVSCRSEKEALIAQGSGADYVALSPVFSTETKIDLDSPSGFEGIRRFSEILEIPLVAIGGIKDFNAAQVIAAGADCAAVVTAITMAENIRSAVIDLKKRIEMGFILRNR